MGTDARWDQFWRILDRIGLDSVFFEMRPLFLVQIFRIVQILHPLP
jgi:hypothetical protein